MEHDYRSTLLALIEKLIRQRSYWFGQSRLPGLEIAIKDIEFVLEKAMAHLPEDFIEDVQETVNARYAERQARHDLMSFAT